MRTDPPPSPVESCVSCGLPLDLSDVAPLTIVECPGCANPQTVFQHFGPFKLERLLGKGGMGAVYKAQDLGLNRSVALKVLQENLSHDLRLTSQFEREAALTARITHPNVVRVYSTGSAHGMFYIAMELVDQGSLDALMETTGSIPEAEVLQIGIQIAEGLQAAHKAGLIHRDIKPGNILFSHHNQAKIVDFGLALQSNQNTPSNSEIWGTPFYIAPESLNFKPEDFRSDMYALGSSLWHALTGSPPYPNQTVSVHELLHIKKKPVDLKACFPSAHPFTVATLNRCVSFAPNDRHQDYDSLIADLKSAHAAVMYPEGFEPLPSPSKNRLLKASLAIGILVLASGGGVWWWKTHSQNLEAQGAPEPAFQSDAERLSNAVKLLQEPAKIELAIRRMRLIAASPDLSPALHFWTQISLGVGLALHGDPNPFGSSFKDAESVIPSLDASIQPFAEWLLKVSTPPPAQPSDLPPDWKAVRELIETINLVRANNLSKAKETLKKVIPKNLEQNTNASDLTFLAELLTRQLNTLDGFQRDLNSAINDPERPARLKRIEEQISASPLIPPCRKIALSSLKTAREAPAPPSSPPPPPAKPSPTAEKTTPTAPNPPPPAPPPQPAIPFVQLPAREKVSNHAQSFRFKEALKEVALVIPISPAEAAAKSRLENITKSSESLFRWAIQEINKGGTLPSPILKNGSVFKSDPVRGDDSVLFVKTTAASAPLPIPWTDVSAAYVVKIAQFRLKDMPNSPQRADLLWSTGNFLLLTGPSDRAVPVLEEAAKINPAYRELLPNLLGPDAKP